ncbi:MAG: DUF4405 domain-containing protein [Pirellulales bacterium]|nr:DUF4405 domain-containing protein [Pirellulales bacterium]
MSRTVLNFLVDLALLLITTTLLWTAVVVHFVFPPGTDAAGWTLWGLGYDDWTTLQFSLLCVVALTILLHVMLHWSWVCGVVITRILKRKKAGGTDDGSQTIYGVATLIVLLNVIGGMVALASLMIRPPA